MALQYLISFFKFLASPFGAFALLLGLVSFLLLPLGARFPGDGRRGAHFLLWLAQTAATRSAVVVSEAGETFYKTLSYNDQGVFEARFNDGNKVFEDPADAMSRFFGGSFCLADEQYGVIFDPRFAAVGKRKNDVEEKEELYFKATSGEAEVYGVRGWVRGVFELPSTYELVDLTSVRPLISGGERAEYGKKIEELYKFSREPYKSSRAILRVLLPAVVFLVTLGGMWLIADQASSGATSSVSFGFLWLLLAIPSREEIDWKRLGLVTAAVLTPVAFLGALAYLTGVVFTVMVLMAFGLGFTFFPILTLISRVSSRLSGFWASLWMKLGLMGYDRPVFVWTKEGYELHEYDTLDDVGEVNWYDFAGSTCGFTFHPSVDELTDAWTAEKVDASSEASTDGGPKTNIPPGYRRCEKLRRGPYGGFTPTSPDSRKLYVKAGRAMSRLTPAATGWKSKKSLEHAREKYGLGWAAQMSDKTIAYMSFALMLIAIPLGVWLFFL